MAGVAHTGKNDKIRGSQDRLFRYKISDLFSDLTDQQSCFQRLSTHFDFLLADALEKAAFIGGISMMIWKTFRQANLWSFSDAGADTSKCSRTCSSHCAG